MDIKSLISLWNHTQQHPGTSGARACAGVLLGLYNGNRFPFDLIELRLLDRPLREAALAVIAADATHCEHEVHTWLNIVSAMNNFGERLEWLASDYKCFKRGAMSLKDLREEYSMRPVSVVIEPQGNRAIPSEGEPRGLGAQRQAVKMTYGEPVRDAAGNIKQLMPELRLNAEQAAAVKAMTDNLPE